MSPLLWLQRLFVPQNRDDQLHIGDIPDMEDDNPFVFTTHMRIVLAILVTFISALVMWWIVA